LTGHGPILLGEKPYDCTQCGFGFTRRDALRKHQQRTNHGSYAKLADNIVTPPAHGGHPNQSGQSYSRPQSAASSLTAAFSPEKILGGGGLNHSLHSSGVGGVDGEGCSWGEDIDEGGLDLSITSTVDRPHLSVMEDSEVSYRLGRVFRSVRLSVNK